MKFAELKDLTLQELAARSNEMRRELFNLRLQKASAQLEKTARVRTLRKDIARVETAISERRNKPATPAAP
ncbi:MAG: 50S ribosomal protein L29 [Candidatus Hydrogenedentes bacterium]|jgi:large subunit ribosomal protein L29|nr:50S ribosomal protein L29 [Candidatus Hydrogenedentota bacterium]